MKLSLRGEYALRAMIVLGQSETNSIVRIQTISERQKIPKRFLAQILNELKAAGILESRLGAAGGYRMSKPANRVSLASIIRHIEGPLAPVSCVSERFYAPCTCPDETKCAVRNVMKEVREAIVGILETVTVADLCARAKKLESLPANPLDYVI